MSGEVSRWPSLEGVEISVDESTSPFWDAAAEHRLVVQRCSACGFTRLPPTAHCPSCLSRESVWPEVSGRGVIYSYTIVSKAVGTRQIGHVPYVPALIEPDDAPGVRIISTVVDAAIGSIDVGARVELVWQDGDGGLSVPRFRIVRTFQP